MDARSRLREIIVALVGIGLVVLVIVLLVKAFTGHAPAPSSRINVGDYADTAAVATLLVDGPTNLNQLHNQVKISVSGTSSEIDIIQGYQGDVIRSKTYASNSAAYAQFLQSLQLLNFSKGAKSTVDYRGYCPSGNRYVYSFVNGGDTLFSYWSTSCGGQGTFEGSAQPVRALFMAQIPPNDLSMLMSNVNVAF